MPEEGVSVNYGVFEMVGSKIPAFKCGFEIKVNAGGPWEPRTQMPKALDSWFLVSGAWLHLHLHLKRKLNVANPQKPRTKSPAHLRSWFFIPGAWLHLT